MSLAWESAALAALPISCQRVVSDSRQVVRGDVFLAFRGEYADGRDFIPAALAKGAAAILTDLVSVSPSSPGSIRSKTITS